MNIGYDGKYCRFITQIIWIIKTIYCGSHSGIPPCCILHFIYCAINEKYKERFREKYETDVMSIIRYAPCPICIKAKDFIEVKSCPEDGWCFSATNARNNNKLMIYKH